MTRHHLTMAVLLAATTIAYAQDTYLNDRLTATDDLHGTARYVGMGGAMGALGADLSVISANPAGIALYRKSDIALTFGALIPSPNGWDSKQARTYGEHLATASFDQAGGVWSIKTDGNIVKYVNFGLNWQKKANYNMGFYADSPNLGGLSQMDQIAELATGTDGHSYATDHNLAGLAAVPVLGNSATADYYLSKDANGVYRNLYSSAESAYDRHQTGWAGSYDLNMSFNLNDRAYLGATFGIDHVNYKSWSEYGEWGADGGLNHTLYNDREINGNGINAKLGLIVRPIQDNPLRIGLAVETPTWYRLESSTLFHLDQSDEVESYLEYTVRSPWRARLSLGSTLDRYLAWGIEYEYANTAKTRMGYPRFDDWDDNHSAYASTGDPAMNSHTAQVMRPQHTLKLGIEAKPIAQLAIRAGYNYVSRRYRDNARFDQFSINSPAMDYATSTDYTTLGATNIATLGLGYKYKKFYADLAYKYRMQSARFHPFDTSFAAPAGQFAQDNPQFAGATIAPLQLDLNRHQLMLTLGFKL